MRRLFLLPFLALALAAAVAGCGGGGTAALGTDDVAVVSSQTITKDDFQSLMGRAKKSYQSQKRAFPKAGTSDYESLKGQAISFLVQRAEYADKAEEMGIEITDAKIDQRIARLKKQYYGGKDKKYRDALAQQGLTEEQAREEIRAQLISEELFKQVTDDVKVDDKAVRDYFDSHKSQYGQAESRDVRHILVPSKALADRLYTQIKGGADFANSRSR